MPPPTCRPLPRLLGLRGMHRWLGPVIRMPRGRLPCQGPRPRPVGCRALRRARQRLPPACLARGLPPQLSPGATSPRGTRRSWLRVRPWRRLPQSRQGCHIGQACCRWCLLLPGEGRRDSRSPHQPHALIHTRQLGRRPARMTFLSRSRGPLLSCLRLIHSDIAGRRRPWPNCNRRSRLPRSRIFPRGLWCIASPCKSSNNARRTRPTTARSSAPRRAWPRGKPGRLPPRAPSHGQRKRPWSAWLIEPTGDPRPSEHAAPERPPQLTSGCRRPRGSGPRAPRIVQALAG